MAWLIILLAALMFGAKKTDGGDTPEPGSGLPTLEEERIPYRARSIFVAKTSEDIPEPWRWRAADAAGEPIANATGWAATREAAILAAQGAIDASDVPRVPGIVVEPPRPPAPEGGAAPVGPACETVRRDGDFAICLYPQGNGRWGYRATDAAGVAVATSGGFMSKAIAQVAAWRMLAEKPTQIVGSTRNGAQLDSSSNVQIVDRQPFLARAVPVIQAELGKGEQDPRGLVLAIWSAIWPSINPLRVRLQGETLGATAQRFASRLPNAQEAVEAMIGPPNAGGWSE